MSNDTFDHLLDRAIQRTPMSPLLFVAWLLGIDDVRLTAILNGAQPTEQERASLTAWFPELGDDWRLPEGGGANHDKGLGGRTAWG